MKELSVRQRSLLSRVFPSFSQEEIQKLVFFEDPTGIKAILNGQAEIEYLNLIDYVVVSHYSKLPKVKGLKLSISNSRPFSKLELSKKGFYLSDRCLYLSEKQKNGCLSVADLKDEIRTGNKDFSFFGEYEYLHLLKNLELIPKEWENYNLLLLDSIYSDKKGKLFVRCLSYSHMKWVSEFVDYNECAVCCDSKALITLL